MLKNLSKNQIKTEVLCGLTVAIALVPEAVAFAFIAQVNPLVGLYAAFVVGLITSIFGGRPGMISGAAGALAVVMVSLVVNHGVQYLFATVILMGIIQLLCGLLKLGKFIKIVPYPVVLGFVNGLAIVIFLAQIDNFKQVNSAGNLAWLPSSSIMTMLILIVFTMLIIFYLPRLTKVIPSSLAAIIIVVLVVWIFNIETKSVGDIASIAGSFPKFSIPDVKFNLETLKIIFPYAFILASIGIIESLLALTLIDEITESNGRRNKECSAQGFANIVTGFFGGMGGCAMIGQSMINISSGARHRLSGICAALFLLSFILFASSLIEAIPIAVLVGIMFVVVISTFSWSSLRIMHKIPKTDAFVIIIVSIITVFFDLAIAVLSGIIISALVYVWKSSTHIHIKTEFDQEKGEKTYIIFGPLFFGSINSFNEIFKKQNPDEVKSIILNFQNSRVWDHSGMEALKKIADKLTMRNKKVRYSGLSNDCARVLERSGCKVEKDKEADPKYALVVDSDYKIP